MKKIEAVLPSARLERAFSALSGLNIGGLTYYDSKGHGEIPRPQMQSGRGTSVYTPDFNANSTVVLVVSDSMAEQVIKKILESTSTGIKGEGKIFVSDIDDAVDIGSKVHGVKAI